MKDSAPTLAALATPKEAAAFLRTTPAALAQSRYMGRGPEYARLGGRILYPWDALRAYVTTNAVRPTAEQSGAA